MTSKFSNVAITFLPSASLEPLSILFFQFLVFHLISWSLLCRFICKCCPLPGAPTISHTCSHSLHLSHMASHPSHLGLTFTSQQNLPILHLPSYFLLFKSICFLYYLFIVCLITVSLLQEEINHCTCFIHPGMP